MNLGVSIANLLRRYPAVAVPGIGVFKKTREPASYDADKSAYLPPVERIELVKSNEDTRVFSITTYLKTQQQVDGSAAMIMLEAAVAEVMDSARRDGQALITGLGYLSMDGLSVVFKPFEAGAWVTKPIAAPAPVSNEAPAPNANDSAIDESAGLEMDGTGADHRGRRRSVPWIIAAAVAFLLVGVTAMWRDQLALFGETTLLALFRSEPEPQSPMANETPKVELPPLVDEEPDSVPIVDTGQVAGAAETLDLASADSVAQTNAPSAKPSVTYEIIVGSFATMRQANKFVTEMKAKGYDLEAIDSRMPGNRKKISWGSFATEDAAYKELARVQKTFEPGAWIAKIEHE